jgi:hypothetical protein
MLHLVVDVLVELNKLNEKIQYDMVNISAIGRTVDASISILRNTFYVALVQNLIGRQNI